MVNTPKKPYLRALVSGAALFYVFSGISSLLNYAFYPIIGRVVSVGQYGEIQFLISMFNQLAVGFVVLNILAIIISVKAASNKEQSDAIQTLNHVSIAVMLPIIIIVIGIMVLQRHTIGINEPWAIVSLGLAILISIPYTTSIGKLQGNGQFLASGIINTLGALGKMLFSLLFVVLGFGVTGAILGVGIGLLIPYIVSVLIDTNRSTNSWREVRLKRTHLLPLAPIRNQAIVALLVMILLTIVSVFDTIISRLVLSHTAAGQYAAVATTTKIVLAAAMPLMWLALPYAAKHQRRSIVKYTVLTASLSVAFCIFIAFTNSFSVHLLTGINAGHFLSYSVVASIAMSLCAIAFLLGAVTVTRHHLRIAITAGLSGLILGGILFCSIFKLSPLYAAFSAQIICSLAIIVGGVLSLQKES